MPSESAARRRTGPAGDEVVTATSDVCDCTTARKDGFGRRDDGMWVHVSCWKPTALYREAMTRKEVRDGVDFTQGDAAGDIRA